MSNLVSGAPAPTSSLVSLIGGQAKTTSFLVAYQFDVRYNRVLRASELAALTVLHLGRFTLRFDQYGMANIRAIPRAGVAHE